MLIRIEAAPINHIVIIDGQPRIASTGLKIGFVVDWVRDGATLDTALAQTPNVDPKRIGVVGHSYGGKWAMFASCLYDKFAAAAWSASKDGSTSTSKVPEAQKFFNQGVGQLHGFWYYEAERSFRQVAGLDPDLTAAGLAPQIQVFDPASAPPKGDDDLEIGPSPDGGVRCDVGGYAVVGSVELSAPCADPLRAVMIGTRTVVGSGWTTPRTRSWLSIRFEIMRATCGRGNAASRASG